MRTGLKAFLIAAGSILLLFLIGDLFGFRSGRKDPRSTVMELDTSMVSMIAWESRLEPQEHWVLERSMESRVGNWVRTPALDPSDPRSAMEEANDLLYQFQSVPVKREMGMIKLLGERYELTEETLDRITFTYSNGGQKVLNLGSTTFAPGKIGIWTYVNVKGEREVYAVEGALAAAFRKGASFGADPQ